MEIPLSWFSQGLIYYSIKTKGSAVRAIHVVTLTLIAGLWDSFIATAGGIYFDIQRFIKSVDF